ncbi:transcriptional regulator [Cupriavidus oxalaticus]|uniref:Helix-turn-helix domain-containing protein n=1 Tax=Cupriavidus oxalaticus TaxID=96344 RepID=A0A4P7LJ07_9BURK|nr:YdaS family helix-turn-helix protein [Cupriavidus oxalaticus]QBY56136.1 hypothetical protein E0W60_34320 [Cupriavidus oxalaticus]
MDLHTYLIQSERTQQDFAAALGVSQSLICHWARRKALPSPAWCVSIERFTEGRVSRTDLRPDDWREIWPELTWPSAWQEWGSEQALPLAALHGDGRGGGPALCAAPA